MRGNAAKSELSRASQRCAPTAGVRGASSGNWPTRCRKSFSSQAGSTSAWASEKLAALTRWPQTPRCTFGIRLAWTRPRTVRVTGLNNASKNKLK